MKKVLFLFFLTPVLSWGQVRDNFETGGLTNWISQFEEHWKADTLYPLSGRFSMVHAFDNTVAGYDQTGLSLKDLKPSSGTTTWTFKIRYGYNPSASNNWSCFLMSDQGPSSMMPGGNINGFAIGVNLSGYDDTLRLWKISNGTVNKVLNTGVNWEKDIGINSFAEIKIERSAAGVWKTIVTKDTLSIGWMVEVTDSDLFTPLFFGFYYKYTLSGDRLLWIDDINIEGVFYSDTIPPQPEYIAVSGKDRLIVTFDESPDIQALGPDDFWLVPDSTSAVSIRQITQNSVEVVFSRHFMNKSDNELVIKSVCDTSGNCINGTSLLFKPLWADPGDLTISEIMADPIPSAGLPEKEYLEIVNTTRYSFSLNGWTIVSGTSKAFFPDINILPGEILILCNQSDTSLFNPYGKVAGMRSFPLLSDGGKLLAVLNEYNELVHGIEYSPEWYGDILKSEGGWSLETEDTSYPFFYEGNWRASVSRNGGTPGSVNSVSGANRDKECPVTVNVFPDDSITLSVRFSEPVNINRENISGIAVNNTGIRSIVQTDPLFRSYSIKTTQILEPGEIYEFALPDYITDFASNSFCNKIFTFGLPVQAEKGDIKFNELLFDPYPGGSDYIELFNCSENTIDAAMLSIYSISEENDTSSLVKLYGEHRCILPRSYFVITEDKSSLEQFYSFCNSAAIAGIPESVTMGDANGHLVLVNRELDIVDEVIYNRDFHFAILSDYEGVALEKIQPCLESSERENWQSASETSGWGTPGNENSVFTESIKAEDEIVFSSTKISPDNDGFEDFLIIGMNFINTGTVITAVVYDEEGYPVRYLANNLLTGSSDSIVWNGTDSNGSLVRTGFYIIYISAFDETGKVMKTKKVCAVIRQ